MYVTRKIATAGLAAMLLALAACTDNVGASPELAGVSESPTVVEQSSAPSELKLELDTEQSASQNQCEARGTLFLPKLPAGAELTALEAKSRAGINDDTTYMGESAGTEYSAIITLDGHISINLWVRAHMGAWVVEVRIYDLDRGTQTQYLTDISDSDGADWVVAADGTAALIPTATLYNMTSASGDVTLRIEDLEVVCALP